MGLWDHLKGCLPQPHFICYQLVLAVLHFTPGLHYNHQSTTTILVKVASDFILPNTMANTQSTLLDYLYLAQLLFFQFMKISKHKSMNKLPCVHDHLLSTVVNTLLYSILSVGCFDCLRNQPELGAVMYTWNPSYFEGWSRRIVMLRPVLPI